MWHQNGFYLLFHKKSINWRRKKEKNKNNNQTFKKDQINSLTYLWKKITFAFFIIYDEQLGVEIASISFKKLTNPIWSWEVTSTLVNRWTYAAKNYQFWKEGLDFKHCIRGRHYLPCYTFVRRSFPNQIPVQKGIPCLTLFSSNHQFHCSRIDMFQLMQQCFQLQKLPQPL